MFFITRCVFGSVRGDTEQIRSRVHPMWLETFTKLLAKPPIRVAGPDLRGAGEGSFNC